MLPKVFDTPCIADVTDEYMETSDVTVCLEHPELAGSRLPIWLFSTTASGKLCIGGASAESVPCSSPWGVGWFTFRCITASPACCVQAMFFFGQTRPGS